MNNEISLLAQFLESLGPEVSGHSASPLTEEQLERIRLFASGKLGPNERLELLPSILENETALHTLVKTLRAQA
jgi:hypothetical protein